MKRILFILSILLPLGAFQAVSAQITVSSGVQNASPIYMHKPVYPAAARFVRASGTVQVLVLVNEKGYIYSAKALSGHALLRPEAVRSALRSRFEPVLLHGKKPVKASGIITYIFSLR